MEEIRLVEGIKEELISGIMIEVRKNEILKLGIRTHRANSGSCLRQKGSPHYVFRLVEQVEQGE
ncbi:hypothetical protein ACFL6S_08405 [Candidatus Poribacteria bacterium]